MNQQSRPKKNLSYFFFSKQNLWVFMISRIFLGPPKWSGSLFRRTPALRNLQLGSLRTWRSQRFCRLFLWGIYIYRERQVENVRKCDGWFFWGGIHRIFSPYKPLKVKKTQKLTTDSKRAQNTSLGRYAATGPFLNRVGRFLEGDALSNRSHHNQMVITRMIFLSPGILLYIISLSPQ